MEEHPIRTTLIALAALALVGLGIWGFNVLASPMFGAGDAYAQKNSARNWVSAQAGFHQDYESVRTFNAQLGDAQRKLADFEHNHPGLGNNGGYDPMAEQDADLRRTVTGLQQQCQNTVTAYNTRAQSYLTAEFRDAGLPDRLDPATDCAGTTTFTASPTTTSQGG